MSLNHVSGIVGAPQSPFPTWPFPTDAGFDKGLDSNIADVKQCSIDGGADHILAARFLNRFVDEKISWLHIDLASASNKGWLAHIPIATTGFGVRYTLNLVMDKQLVKSR